mgnify:CR=1 FL=1|jgi:N-acetylglucosamine-6-phosphate deacetylase
MEKKVLVNGLVFDGKEFVPGQAVVIEGARIGGVVPAESSPANVLSINCKGHYIVPGFIDLQVYGAGGCLFSNDPSPASLMTVGDALVASGATAFMLTLATNSMEVFRQAIQVVKENPHPALLGLHLEGPYINPVKRGAHIQQYIKTATVEEVQALLQEAGGVVKMITLAPELTDAAVIELLLQHNVLISAGHSNASFREAMDGFQRGIQAVTHLYNAMSPLHHRDMGLPGAAFASNAYASIIADGIHVDYEAIKIAKKLMGERLFLITDAVEEVLEGPYIHVRRSDRFTLPDGTLSGSCLTMLKAVENCVRHAHIPLEEAVRMASLYPARLIGAAEHMGSIQAGSIANLVVFDAAFQLQRVFFKGEEVNQDNL